MNGDIYNLKEYENGVIQLRTTYKTDRSYTLYKYKNGKQFRVEGYNKNGSNTSINSVVKTKLDSGYKLKKVDACDYGGYRDANTVVDIGIDSSFANRDYYGYTNKYGQLTKVEAAMIIPQNEIYEDVVLGTNGKGTELRYCDDEAYVIGVLDGVYNSGHVIADSFGGVGNAYNITPQI